MKVNITYKSIVVSISIDKPSIAIIDLQREFLDSIDKLIKNISNGFINQDDTKAKVENVTYIAEQSFSNSFILLNELNDEYRFFSKSKKLFSDSDIIKPADGCNSVDVYYASTFNYHPQTTYKESKDVKIEDLITKVTGGSKPLPPAKEKKQTTLDNFFSSSNEESMLLNAIMNLRGNRDPQQRDHIINNMILPILSNSNNANPFPNIVRISNNNSIGLNVNPISQPLRAHQPMQPVQPNPNAISQLVEMGFEEVRARRALIATRNNLEAAVEMIANDEDLGNDNDNEENNLQNEGEDYEIEIEESEVDENESNQQSQNNQEHPNQDNQ